MTADVCKSIGLRFYPDSRPGFRRKRWGKGFSYTAPDGTRVDCLKMRKRLHAMAVPPAYSDVWLSPHRIGHLQATGRDASDRKQYRYHPDWVDYHAAQKFERLPELFEGLARMRRWAARQLAQNGEDRDTAIATALALMDRLSLRIGNPRYTAENGSFGAITLRRRHLVEDDEGLSLRYTAKGGDAVEKRIVSGHLASRLQRASDGTGKTLIGFRNGQGRWRALSAPIVTERLQELIGADVSPKDLRTWNGSHAAFAEAVRLPKPTLKEIAQAAAERLHNTPTIARNSYVHPSIIDALKKGQTLSLTDGPTPNHLRSGERELAALIK